MKICIAQTKSLNGNIAKNILNHLEYIKHAVKYKADLIIFPELSITNYEPQLAKTLAKSTDSSIFNPFQKCSNKNNITIGVGMPTSSNKGLYISMLIFQPNKKRVVYSKQMLHEDELPYFVCGKTQTILNIKEQKVTIGICYETLQREHFLNSYKKGIDFYIASVAKSKDGIKKAYKHFSETANEFSIPILMSNCVGTCSSFMATGQSAVWNKKGELISQLDNNNQGLLIYDTKLDVVTEKQLIKD